MNRSFREKQNTHFIFYIYIFSKNHAIFEMMLRRREPSPRTEDGMGTRERVWGGRWAQIDTSAVERLGRRNPVGGMERSGAETQIKSKYRKCNSVFKHIIHSNGLGVLMYITSKHKSVTYQKESLHLGIPEGIFRHKQCKRPIQPNSSLF